MSVKLRIREGAHDGRDRASRAKAWADSLVRARERVAAIREFVVEGTLNGWSA